jgi:hypothetical protein
MLPLTDKCPVPPGRWAAPPNLDNILVLNIILVIARFLFFFELIGCMCGGLEFGPLKGRGFFFAEANSWSGIILLRLGLSSG